MGTWQYRYDDNSNIIEQTDAKGILTYFGYDELDRLVRESSQMPGGGSVYDAPPWAVGVEYHQGDIVSYPET